MTESAVSHTRISSIFKLAYWLRKHYHMRHSIQHGRHYSCLLLSEQGCSKWIPVCQMDLWTNNLSEDRSPSLLIESRTLCKLNDCHGRFSDCPSNEDCQLYLSCPENRRGFAVSCVPASCNLSSTTLPFTCKFN
jgi:hypothetical protein